MILLHFSNFLAFSSSWISIFNLTHVLTGEWQATPLEAGKTCKSCIVHKALA